MTQTELCGFPRFIGAPRGLAFERRHRTERWKRTIECEGPPVPRYMLEDYVPGLGRDDLRREIRRITEAIEDLRRGGMDVLHVRSVLLPEDEMCLHYVDASAAAAAALLARAGSSGQRLSEVVE